MHAHELEQALVPQDGETLVFDTNPVLNERVTHYCPGCHQWPVSAFNLLKNPVRLMFCMPQSMSTQKPGLSIFFMTHSLTEAMNFQSRVLWQSGGTCPTPSSRPAYARLSSRWNNYAGY